jgi:16S rRNA (cytosine967-C5)-methyltransferase
MKIHQNIVDAILLSLKEIFENNRYADKVIERVLKSNPKWGARDRKFIAESTYDIVRWYRLLDYATPPSEYKLNKLFRTYCVLKGIDNDESIAKRLEEAKAVRKIRESIPDWLDELALSELGEERWETELSALNQEAKVVLRTNTLKTTPEELHKKLVKEGTETEIAKHHSTALILSKRKNIFTSALFKDGFFEVQDYSSQLIAPYLDIQEGMRVVDACAGAGGKTLHLAALLKNKGKIIAMDTEQWKLDELKKRARRAGAFNIEPRLIESLKTIKRLEGTADRLLLDVPCSGLGVLRRNPDAKWKLDLPFIETVRATQQKIVNDYCILLKTNGILVYSTCSILPSENEKQIDLFIRSHPGKFELLSHQTIYPSEGFDGFYMAKIKKL